MVRDTQTAVPGDADPIGPVVWEPWEPSPGLTVLTHRDSPEGPRPELKEREPPESKLCPEIHRGALTARLPRGPRLLFLFVS